MVSVGVKKHHYSYKPRPSLNGSYGLCGPKETFEEEKDEHRLRAQELCETVGGRPGLPSP